MGKIKGIIFDLDDTLYNEIDYVKSGYLKVATYLEPLVYRADEEIFALLMDRFNEDRSNVFNYVLEVLGVENDEVLMECLDIYRNQEPDIFLDTETEELLLELKKEYKLGVITDGRPEGQWAKIRALGLVEIIDEIIVTDELGGIEYRKPNKTSYEMISCRLGIPVEQLVYIGDNPKKDFIAPRQLGMSTIRLNNEKGLYYNDMILIDEYYALKEIKCLKQIKGLLEVL